MLGYMKKPSGNLQHYSCWKSACSKTASHSFFLSFWAIWSSAARQRDTWNSDAILHGPLHVSEAMPWQCLNQKWAPKIGASMTQSSRLLLGSKGSVSPLRLPDPSTRDVAHARCTFVCWVAHGSCSLPSRLMHQMVCPNLIVEGLWPSLWDRSNNKSEYIQSNKNKNIHMNFPKNGLYTSVHVQFMAIWCHLILQNMNDKPSI